MKKTWLLLVGAVILGVVAAFLSIYYLHVRENQIRASLAGREEAMVSVVVANRNLPKGTQVSGGLFAQRDVPADLVHQDAIRPGDFDRYTGRFLTAPLRAGTPLLRSQLNETFPVDFSDTIPEGRRAKTVQVDEVNSIAGMIRPGNHVDIFVNVPVKTAGFQPAVLEGNITIPQELVQAALDNPQTQLPAELRQLVEQQGTRITEPPSDVILPVLQDVRVLATGDVPYQENLDQLHQPQRRGERTFTNVTLDLSPEQAALLAIAEDKGDLIALLRNRNDESKAPFEGITAHDLTRNAREMRKAEALRKAAAAAGATIDENGNWVNPDGTVVRKEDIQVSESGAVTTSGGKLLSAPGIRMNADGQYVDENGNVIPEDEIVRRPDGSITTRTQLMKDAGYTVDENGNFVDKDGNVIRKEDVKVLDNGAVVGADGEVISGPRVTKNKDGFYVDDKGNVYTADGKRLDGVSVNEQGQVVGPDGRVLTDPNLTVAEDGTVRDSSGRLVAGVTGGGPPREPSVLERAQELIEGATQAAAEAQPPAGGAEARPAGPSVDLIAGGKSKNGVAEVDKLPILP